MKKSPVELNHTVLAIDTSCDETCAAVVKSNVILSNVVASQANLHQKFGGVFPTLAKQAHRDNIDHTIRLALQQAGIGWVDVSQIKVTVGPGLAPALEVGILTAQTLGKKYHLPVLPANHIEGHILSVLAQPKPKSSATYPNSDLTPNSTLQAVVRPTPNQPILSLVVSGGHTLFIKIETTQLKKIQSDLTWPDQQLDRQPNLKLTDDQTGTVYLNSGSCRYTILGQTLDDAAGECLDKIGRMINLGYPAGPVMEQLAKTGDAQKYPFPLPMTDRANFDMSFSGLKTYARNLTEKNWGDRPLTKQETADFCASAQYAVFQHICYKLNKLLQKQTFGQVWLGGGVAANMTLRKMLRQTIRQNHNHVTNQKLATPYSKRLCGDNAGMVGVN